MSFLAKYSSLLIAVLMGTFAFSQTTSIIIKSDEKIQLFAYDQLLTPNFVQQIAITGIKANQNLNFTIKFSNDSLVSATVLVIDGHTQQHYFIKNKKFQFQKILFLPYHQKLDSTFYKVSLVKTPPTEITEEPTDSITKDTLITEIPFDDYYKMPDYNGAIGCPWPLKDEDLNELTIQLSNLTIDDRKVSAFNDFKEGQLNFCITINQLKTILGFIEYDEYKIEIVKNSFSFIYDKDNVVFLEPEFSYQNSFDELKKQLGI